MALDLPLPHQVLTHAHWTLGHEKMSKSIGNVVNPFFALERFGVDTMRYYLAHDGGIQDDSDYDNSHIIEKYKKGLQGGLGNLTSRIMRGKTWNVRKAVQSFVNVDLGGNGSPAAYQQGKLKSLADVVEAKMQRLDLGAGLKDIMNTIYTVSTLILTPSRSGHSRIIADY